MARSKSSKGWLKEHFDDVYVKKSQQMGYRSRASFKLLEIQEKDHLIKPGMTVIDLGAAPGGWSQVAVELVGPNGRVLANDILPIDAIAGVEFICGDFTEEIVLNQIKQTLGDSGVDLVISDMAPNMSGMKDIDQPQAMYLAELALDLAKSVLTEDGSLVIKVFQGSGLEIFQTQLRSCFGKVKNRKPKASRPRSRELYLIATGFMAAH
jgi:23S rRNA (uridine2552-2'-O)-methyltransferase